MSFTYPDGTTARMGDEVLAARVLRSGRIKTGTPGKILALAEAGSKLGHGPQFPPLPVDCAYVKFKGKAAPVNVPVDGLGRAS